MSKLWTVRTRFIWFGILSLIPLIGFNWLLVSEHNRTRFDDLVASESILSSQIVNSVSGFLSLTYRGLEGMASSPVLLEQTAPDQISAYLGQARVTRPEQSGIYLINTDGQVVGESGIDSNQVLPSISSYVDSVLATGQRTVSGRVDLRQDPPTSVFTVLVPVMSVAETAASAPTPTPPPSSTNSQVTNESNATPTPATQPAGTIRGVLVAVIPTDALIAQSFPSVRGGTDVLVLSDRQVVAATGEIRSNETGYVDNLFNQTNVFTDETTDVFRFTGMSGTGRVGVWAPITLETSGWGVLVTSPAPESQLTLMWRDLLAMFLVASLVYLIISFAFGELSFRALSDISESARGLADGDYHTPIPRRGFGEFGELREALASIRERTEVIMTEAENRQADRQLQTEQMRDLLRRDLRMQEDERRHIASEIHDAVSPLITGALYQSRALQRSNGGATPEMVQDSLTDVNDLLERASQELHGIIFDLRPPDLDDLGVVAAIEAFVATIQRTGLEARLEVIDDPPPLTPEVRLGVYRIVQEALHNVLRHSGADEAVVRMEYVNQLLRVTIRDNGSGFDPESARRPTSLGLLSMRERAASIDADFEILSRPGGGTVIIVERRDTGSIMGDELLDSILRDRTAARDDAVDDDSDSSELGSPVADGDAQNSSGTTS